MGYDHYMFDAEQDMEMRCQSSNLNEELGQVEYVFSDKTGTLTANIMEFRKFTSGVNFYGTDKDGGKDQESNVNFCDDKMYQHLNGADGPEKQDLEKVILHLALCHTIIVDEKKKTYNAASPDELALVNAAKQFGYEFKGIDKDDNMIVNIKKKDGAQ